jgi:hypothetical protein
MPLLISGGDSFTWGSELEIGPNEYSHQTWSYLLANKLGYEYACTAKPGGSNSAICRRIISEVVKQSFKHEKIFVAVMWTFTHRDEIRLRNGITQFSTDPELELDNNWTNFTPWQGISREEKIEHMNIKDGGDVKIDFFNRHHDWLENSGVRIAAEKFYSVTGDHIYSLYQTLKEIIVLQTFLESKGIEYFFCSASYDIFKTRPKDQLQNKELSPLGLYGTINWNKWYKDNVFHPWAIYNNYEMRGTHPGPTAHQDWLQLIMPKVNECWKI